MNWNSAVTCGTPECHEDLRRSFAYCRRVVRHEATNFHYGMRLIPEPKQSATFALYAWLRRADDLADAEDGDCAEKTRRLGAFWTETQTWTDPAADPSDGMRGEWLWPAFRHVVLRYGLPSALLREHIEGQLLDQQKTHYATLDELHDYCHKVAAVVGLLCIRIWGYEGGAHTCRLAAWRGIAFQMTNILRDVREDALRGRVYIPGELLGGRSASPAQVIAAPNSDLAEAIHALAAKAADCYAASAGLEQQVHPDARNCLWAMTQIYSRLLERIRNKPAVVLCGPRLRLPRVTKLWIAAQAMLR